MKKTVLLPVLFTCIINLSYNTHDGEDYREFYRFINIAELLITEAKYLEAYEIYSEAFKTWTNAPAIDYYNALLCSIKLRKYKDAFNYIEILVLKGWELDFFSKNPNLEELRIKAKWEVFVNNYNQLHNNYLESLDSVLIKEINEMHLKDQKLVKSKYYTEYLRTVIFNANRIHQLIIENRCDSLRIKPYSVFYSPFPGVLLRHYGGLYNEVQKGYANVSNLLNDTLKLVDLEAALLIEVKKGHLSPLVYDFSTTYSGNINKFGNAMLFKVGDVLLKKNFTSNEEKKINTNRDSIGQEPFEDYIKKMDFINQLKDSTLKPYYFKFRTSRVMHQMNGKEEQLKKFIENRLKEGWKIISH